jgi:cobalt-precorrin 5A hydrolase/precorrin-3B C17-methyltransferase
VLVVSVDGTSVVPLLGGHRGANKLARALAEKLGAHAAMTTASESKFARGLDEPPPGWVLDEADDARPAMMSLLLGAKIALDGHAPWLAEAGYPISSLGAVKVLVTEQQIKAERGLVYHPKTLVAGVGCERGTPSADIIELVDLALARENLSPQSLTAIATIELKADETGLHEAAAHFGVPLRLFTVAELNQERYRLKTPSVKVEAEVGTPSVAEAAALKAGAIVVPKLKSERATCAIGHATRPIDPKSLGRAPGRLHVVGIGPGAPVQRTASAVRALDRSTDWVGYGLYLDLVGDLKRGQQEHRYHLGDEEARVRHALELAATGKEVALVCSGDGQIYAMASLVYELVGARGERAVSEAARRVIIEAHPGISAVQAASAAAGALIGHDFCCISLSDLLTPREDILRRLDGAATSDFVTALYNPRSQRRTDLIVEAKARFLFYRPKDTPVIVASNLGRADERVRVVRLEDFDPQDVDMLTIVVIGASTSKSMPRGDGRTVAYTPRGYAAKGVPDEVPQIAAAPAPVIAEPAPDAPLRVTSEPLPPAAVEERPVPVAGTAAGASRNAIRAGVAFLRERARHAQVPETGAATPTPAPEPAEARTGTDEPRQH